MLNNAKSSLFNGRKLFIDDLTGVAQYITVYCGDRLSRVKEVADDVVKKCFNFNYGCEHIQKQECESVVFKKEINWCFQPGDDPEWVYELNRMRFWIYLGQCYAVTGDPKYAKAFTEQLTHWVKTVKRGNPKYDKAWRPIEAGIRLENWQKAIRYFEKSEFITDEFCELFISSVTEHCEYIIESYDNSFMLLNSRGVFESHGLFLAGVMLPETERTLEYQKVALEKLTDQIRIQLYGDGMHWEQSNLYHNEVLHCLLDVKILADRNKITLNREFNDRLHIMVKASAYGKAPSSETETDESDETDTRGLITKAAYLYNDGELKFFGYQRFDFDSIWDLGLEASRDYYYIAALTPYKNDIALTESGNYFIHNGYKSDEVFLHFSCGPHGGAHGHDDCLHFNLFANGENIIADKELCAYVPGEMRYDLKKSSAHNIIIVDGTEYTDRQNEILGKSLNNRMFTRGKKEQYTYLEGSSLGYLEKAGVFLNRRIIYIRPDIFVIVDEQFATGKHNYEQYFHFNEKNREEIIRDKNKALLRSDKNVTELIFNNSDNVSGNIVTDNKTLIRNAAAEGFNSLTTVISINKPEHYNELYCNKLTVNAASETGKTIPDKKIEAFSIKKANREYVLTIAHADYGTTGCFITGGCKGFGQAVIFDVARGDKCIGQVLI